MHRLTENDKNGYWCLKGVPWNCICAGQTISEEIRQKLWAALWKLMEYEESGLSPDEVQAMVELYDTRKLERIQMPQKMVDHIMQRFTECK